SPSFLRQQTPNRLFQLALLVFIISDKAPEQPSLLIKHECLRNGPIDAEILVGELVFGNSERILDRKLPGVDGDLLVIIFTADIQSDYLQTLRAVTLL